VRLRLSGLTKQKIKTFGQIKLKMATLGQMW